MAGADRPRHRTNTRGVSSFTKPLILETLSTTRRGRGEFLVYMPFAYDIGYLGSCDTVTVPAGYNTDLCSIPFFARPFIPLAGPYAKPALIHDWMVDMGDPRAHDVFDEALRVAGIDPVRRWILATSVRFYGRWKNFTG